METTTPTPSPPTDPTTEPYRLFHTTVRAAERISPGFVRVTLENDQLRHFAPYGLDQRIKLVLPDAQGHYADFWKVREISPATRAWQQLRNALPEAQRNLMRTYTPSAVRPELGQLDVDFVLHRDPGPASSWAVHAKPGQELVISGPDVRAGNRLQGIQWQPGEAGHLLLLGDETAFPAMRNIVAAQAPGTQLQAFLEVAEMADALAWPSLSAPGLTSVRARNESPYGSQLRSLAMTWAKNTGAAAARQGDDFFAWIAAEAALAAELRHLLVRECGIASSRVHFQGYWNAGPRRTQ
ncbi:hypothetical protein MB46_10610 [Arthrobacter alpinus]|uniref:siderophore-interacting protein n=1 Tax=Arthrobacter alpinus TaxID=656366 RepID=UPI0005C83D2D|nr:siderophore-interacting protein [Arthrobacter alpinus]ALV45866.1 hypothetical protein MB46_10610 [Arthrobacter alpinus]